MGSVCRQKKHTQKGQSDQTENTTCLEKNERAKHTKNWPKRWVTSPWIAEKVSRLHRQTGTGEKATQYEGSNTNDEVISEEEHIRKDPQCITMNQRPKVNGHKITRFGEAIPSAIPSLIATTELATPNDHKERKDILDKSTDELQGWRVFFGLFKK